MGDEQRGVYLHLECLAVLFMYGNYIQCYPNA